MREHMDGPHRWRQEMHHEEREGHEEWKMLSGIQIGLLFNFNVTKRKNGIKRFVLRFLRALRELRGEK